MNSHIMFGFGHDNDSYTMMNGKRKQHLQVLKWLGIDAERINRYRDAGVDRERGFCWVLARTGGHNREKWDNKELTGNPYYQRDQDDPFDSTFAHYYFAIPDAFPESIPHHEDPDLQKMTEEAIKRMEDGNMTPSQEAFAEQLKRILKG